MKHTRSSAEWEIREALVAWLRDELPTARIVHEMNVDNGVNRVDVAAITANKIFAFEIKSERDKLDHLPAQLKAFRACAHHAVLVAHIKWFDQTPYNNGQPRLAWDDKFDLGGGADIWCYPPPDRSTLYHWRLTDHMRASMRQPHAARLLNLLWKAEIVELAHKHYVAVNSRLTAQAIHDMLVWKLTGGQIAEGVCAALRRREFAEADATIGVCAL